MAGEGDTEICGCDMLWSPLAHTALGAWNVQPKNRPMGTAAPAG